MMVVMVKRFLFKSFPLSKDLAEGRFKQGVADDACLGVQHLLGQQHAPAGQFFGLLMSMAMLMAVVVLIALIALIAMCKIGQTSPR